MNWILEKLLKLDFVPGKKRIIAGGTAIVLGWVQYGLTHIPAAANVPPAPMQSIEEVVGWGFTAASALFVYGLLAALARKA